VICILTKKGFMQLLCQAKINSCHDLHIHKNGTFAIGSVSIRLVPKLV
jgi:hypothetical protein